MANPEIQEEGVRLENHNTRFDEGKVLDNPTGKGDILNAFGRMLEQTTKPFSGNSEIYEKMEKARKEQIIKAAELLNAPYDTDLNENGRLAENKKRMEELKKAFGDFTNNDDIFPAPDSDNNKIQKDDSKKSENNFFDILQKSVGDYKVRQQEINAKNAEKIRKNTESQANGGKKGDKPILPEGSNWPN